MARRPAIPVEALGPSRDYARLAVRGLRTLNRDLVLLDLATNPILPTVAAVCLRGGTHPILGLGSGQTHAIAASRAMAELWQALDLETGDNQIGRLAAPRGDQ